MSDFLDAIVDDLRRFSAAALDLNIADAAPTELARATSGSSGLLLRTIARFTAAVPDLLHELEERAEGRSELRATRHPHRARLSTRAADYEMVGGLVRPVTWLATDVVPLPPSAPMRWLVFLAGGLQKALLEASERHERMIVELARARRGGRGWRIDDEPRIEARTRSLRSARRALERVHELVGVAGQGAQHPRAVFPRPFPRGRAWEDLRRLLPALEEPWGSPHERAQHLLSGHAELPDLPFLYQRWCALQVHRVLEGIGFVAHGDAVAVLFGAGTLRYRKATAQVDLHVDPRLVAGDRHPSGFTAVEGREATPDLVLVCSGPQGPEAFILDPTLSTDDEALIAKGRYLDSIATYDLDIVAGVPTTRRSPRRAWAIAPFRAPQNRILDTAGRSGLVGAIPLNPLIDDRRGLEAFIDDIHRFATAWHR